jgi:hypothetical protein
VSASREHFWSLKEKLYTGSAAASDDKENTNEATPKPLSSVGDMPDPPPIALVSSTWRSDGMPFRPKFSRY